MFPFLKWLFGQTPGHVGTYIDEEEDMYVISELGRGSFGEVSLVMQESTGKLYAAKKALNTESDLTEEINACMAVKHPNVARAFPYYYDDGNDGIFILTEFAEGPSIISFMDHLYDEERKLTVPEVAFISREIALGLEAIHRKGMAHRDLSWNNIILAEGRPVIIDFGIAKATFTSATGTMCGTPGFIAPEVGFSESTPVSDIFSVGAIMYFLLFQEPLALGYGSRVNDSLKFIKRGNKGEAALLKIIEQAIEIDRGKRYKSGHKLAADLEPIAAECDPEWWEKYDAMLYGSTKSCAGCETSIPDTAGYCPYCGKKWVKKFKKSGMRSPEFMRGTAALDLPSYLAPYPCQDCDSKNSVHWTYCAACGTELE